MTSKGHQLQLTAKPRQAPIRSLTLRLGTDDDRLRLYWGDGQTSDLACSQEGKGNLGMWVRLKSPSLQECS
jgi:hypothetical protein